MGITYERLNATQEIRLADYNAVAFNMTQVATATACPCLLIYILVVNTKEYPWV